VVLAFFLFLVVKGLNKKSTEKLKIIQRVEHACLTKQLLNYGIISESHQSKAFFSQGWSVVM